MARKSQKKFKNRKRTLVRHRSLCYTVFERQNRRSVCQGEKSLKMLDKGEQKMYIHVEYDDFGEYVEDLDE